LRVRAEAGSLWDACLSGFAGEGASGGGEGEGGRIGKPHHEAAWIIGLALAGKKEYFALTLARVPMERFRGCSIVPFGTKNQLRPGSRS